jgi:hypothetical protein
MDDKRTFTIGYKYHCPNVATRLLHKVLIVSMFVKIAMQALGSCRKVMSITVSISNNNINNPCIYTSFGTRGNSQPPSIMNVSIVANVFASTSALLKVVKCRCGFVVDKFAIDWEPKSGVVVLVWVRIFGFSLGACYSQELLLKMESLVPPNYLPLFLCGISEKSSSLVMMHMSSLTCLHCGGGITPVSKHIGLGAIHLGGRSTASEAGCFLKLGMVFPNLTPNLTISFVSLLFQIGYIFKRSFPCKKISNSSFCG